MNRTILGPVTAVAALLLGGALALPATLLAQTQTSRAGASRFELETTLELARSGSLRLHRRDYDAIQRRLADGDFSAGDQIAIEVVNEPTLTGTFTLDQGPTLALPNIPAISLHGVLRSELADHLTTELGRYLRQPKVDATTLMRIAVFGDVGAPGFYHMSPNLSLSDAIMSAGGITATSDMGKVTITRGTSEVVSKQASAEAITAGTSLDRMNLQGGDAVTVGSQSSGFFSTAGSVLLTAGALAASIIAISSLASR